MDDDGGSQRAALVPVGPCRGNRRVQLEQQRDRDHLLEVALGQLQSALDSCLAFLGASPEQSRVAWFFG